MAKGVVQLLDKDFVIMLNRVKGQRLIKNGFETSFKELTREIANTEEFRRLVEKLNNSRIEVNIRLDKKRLYD